MDVVEDFEGQHITEDIVLEDISKKVQHYHEGKCTKLSVIQEMKCLI